MIVRDVRDDDTVIASDESCFCMAKETGAIDSLSQATGFANCSSHARGVDVGVDRHRHCVVSTDVSISDRRRCRRGGAGVGGDACAPSPTTHSLAPKPS